jgi:hypothetical protein
MRRTVGAAALSFGLLAAPTGALAEGAWTLKSDLDPADGMNCSMETYWDDGSEFSIFANANDFVGFYIMDPTWSLRDGQTSAITFRFGGRSFTFAVDAVEGNAVIGDLSANETNALKFLERWARAYNMSIVFPNGDSWRVNLKGSMATLRQWTDCYDRLEAIANRSGNPFGGGGGGGGGGGNSNPFGGGGGTRPSSNPF